MDYTSEKMGCGEREGKGQVESKESGHSGVLRGGGVGQQAPETQAMISPAYCLQTLNSETKRREQAPKNQQSSESQGHQQGEERKQRHKC